MKINLGKDVTKYSFKCERCGKQFYLKNNYKAHVRTVHEGRRDHKCDVCGEAFFRNDHLQKHILANHSDI